MNGADVVADILKIEGTEFLSCYPRNPVIEALRETRRPADPVPTGTGRSRHRRRLHAGPARQGQRRVRRPARSGNRERFRRGRPSLFGERPRPRSAGGVGARSPVPAPHLQRRGGFRSRDQVARSRPRRPGTAGSASPRPIRRCEPANRARRCSKSPSKSGNRTTRGELDYEPVPFLPQAPDPAAVTRAAELLAEAENPVIWAGQGVLYADAAAELLALAEALPAPVMTTNPGKSAFPEDHPLALGASTRSRSRMLTGMMRKCDVLFAVGSSLTKTPFGPMIPPGKRIVHSTNDASDVNKDYRAEHAVLGDARQVLAAIGKAVGSSKNENAMRRLTGEIADLRSAWLADWHDQPEFGRGSPQPVPHHFRHDERSGSRPGHRHARFRQSARADDPVLAGDAAAFLSWMGQVDPARLRAGP